MGINLAGFCGAASGICGPAGPSTPNTLSPSQVSQLASQSAYSMQAASITSSVTSSLYKVVAAIGKTVVCPTLPFVGGALGASAAVALGLPAITLGPPGFIVEFTAAELGAAIGSAAGESIKSQLGC